MTGSLTTFPLSGKWRWSLYVPSVRCTVESWPTDEDDTKAEAREAGERAAAALGIELVAMVGK